MSIKSTRQCLSGRKTICVTLLLPARYRVTMTWMTECAPRLATGTTAVILSPRGENDAEKGRGGASL